jgi:hypothetical protein
MFARNTECVCTPSRWLGGERRLRQVITHSTQCDTLLDRQYYQPEYRPPKISTYLLTCYTFIPLRVWSSGAWHRVVLWYFSEVHSASIFRKSLLARLWDPWRKREECNHARANGKGQRKNGPYNENIGWSSDVGNSSVTEGDFSRIHYFFLQDIWNCWCKRDINGPRATASFLLTTQITI